ncbi:Hypothetical protein FKW44_007993 [Caligus rogercresseyi]|uniref:Uncharacterized protein n=1 Tax=Caligus rogercresseyi TaxID=217165 RepID=A0A7T8QTZ6_CALRO|nr:Hypothetical protein FKW44_007993 [Caligus rogercresseyi]
MNCLFNDFPVDPDHQPGSEGGSGVNLYTKTLRHLLKEDIKKKSSQDAKKSSLG